MDEPLVLPVKHIYIDVVGYTHNRCVEAQAEIVSVLNEIVLNTADKFGIDKNKRIFIPTGDGICTTFINIETPYDIHMLYALNLLNEVYKHNNRAKDDELKFEIRIGISINSDNIIFDINKSKNVAGAGINIASRIMGFADGRQILVSQPVYDMLSDRKKYMRCFSKYSAKIKHGANINVYQYTNDELPYLNNEKPDKFKTKSKKLSLYEACYFAHAILLQEHLTKLLHDGNEFVGIIILALNARECAENYECASFEAPLQLVYGKGALAFDKVVEYYNQIDIGLQMEFFERNSEILDTRNVYFNDRYNIIINERGKKKLLNNWPELCEKLGIK